MPLKPKLKKHKKKKHKDSHSAKSTTDANLANLIIVKSSDNLAETAKPASETVRLTSSGVVHTEINTTNRAITPPTTSEDAPVSKTEEKEDSPPLQKIAPDNINPATSDNCYYLKRGALAAFGLFAVGYALYNADSIKELPAKLGLR